MAAPMDEDDVQDLVPDDDYYSWLNVPKDAKPEEINNAFRKLGRIFHPDKHVDPAKKLEAETLFSKIKKAHEVLSDPHRRAIYDTMGTKGLETEGWEVVSKTKTPQEIREEYERLQQEAEERRLQQRTNPKGTISVGIDATDFFENYEALEYSDSPLPHVEISSMSISQSVECPLTMKHTAVIAGSLASQNGTGQGTIMASVRRIMSHQSWAEVEVAAGGGAALSVRGFRTLWYRGYGTMAGSLQLTPHGIRPHLNTTIATQLDKNLQGRITWNAGSPSSMSTTLVWDNQRHHIATVFQLGIPTCAVTLNYSYRFIEQDAKAKGALKIGTFGAMIEYGIEKKISSFSVLGASVVVGSPVGVTVKIKLNRGSQSFVFPVHLCDDVVPSAVFYGTVVPLVSYFLIHALIVKPFLKEQKQKDLEKTQEANKARMAEKQKEAMAAIELMTAMYDRVTTQESDRQGLVITKAVYGRLHETDLSERDEDKCIDVIIPLQILVNDSKLLIPPDSHLYDLQGFWDPCVGEEKSLYVRYNYRNVVHEALFKEGEKIFLPRPEHRSGNNLANVNSDSSGDHI